MKIILFIFAVLIIFPSTLSSPNGAPLAACDSETPNHGSNEPQNSSPPIRIVLSQTKIQPGQTINVRLEVLNSSYLFKGFMIQARNVVAPNNLLGTMKTNGKKSQIINCSGPTTATHVNSSPKSSVSVNWIAPQFTGGVRMK